MPSEPAVEESQERLQQPDSTPVGVEEKSEPEATPGTSRADPEREDAADAGRGEPYEADQVAQEGSESADAEESPPNAAAEAGPEAERGESAESAAADAEPGPEAEVVPERLASKSDAELAKTYDLACALLEDAESRRDQQGIGHWRSLAAAALEESVRRPDFGEAAGASHKRLAGRRSRRLIAQLESARQLHLERTS